MHDDDFLCDLIEAAWNMKKIIIVKVKIMLTSPISIYWGLKKISDILQMTFANHIFSGAKFYILILISLKFVPYSIDDKTSSVEGFAQDCNNSILAILQEKKKTDYLKYSLKYNKAINWNVWFANKICENMELLHLCLWDWPKT